MDRKVLLEALSVVRPALATGSLIQSLTYLLFARGEVLAYDDQIGASAPCDAGFEGAVPGATLLSLLGASTAAQVEFAAAAGEVSAKAGGARLKLELAPVDSFLFTMPKVPKGLAPIPMTEKVVRGLEGCLRSVSPDTSVPDQLGVTFIPGKKLARMYSLNGAAMSRASAPIGGLARRVVLSSAFCEQIVRLAKGDAEANLYIADDFALLKLSSGARVFSRLVNVPKPLDFESQFAEIVPRDFAEAGVAVPAALSPAIDRALIISDPTGERTYSQLSVKGGAAELATKSARGEVKDRLKLPGHPDVAVSVDPQWIKVGLSAGFDKLLVTEAAVILGRGSELYLVATSI